MTIATRIRKWFQSDWEGREWMRYAESQSEFTRDITFERIREHVAVERRAAQAAIPERGAFAEGQAAALLSLDQWLAYQEQR